MSNDPGQHFRPPLEDQRLSLAECQKISFIGFSGLCMLLILFALSILGTRRKSGALPSQRAFRKASPKSHNKRDI
jgi:hypothetical protein